MHVDEFERRIQVDINVIPLANFNDYTVYSVVPTDVDDENLETRCFLYNHADRREVLEFKSVDNALRAMNIASEIDLSTGKS